MKVKFWGVRGSFAVDGRNYKYYGGATPCIEIRTNSGICILLDVGSGLYNFANDAALRNDTQNPIILLTHYHRDHLEGLAFYEQFF